MPVDLTLDDDEDTVRRRQRVSGGPREALVVRWSGSSATGQRRRDNQDSWGETSGTRFVVADGVGGVEGGAAASAAAVASFLAAPEVVDDWQQVVRAIDVVVHDQCQNRGHPGAATTIVAAEIVATTISVIHAGDSRAYLLRGGSLLCLTEDHNLANLRRLEGRPPDAADGRGKPKSLTSYLGAGDPELVSGHLRFSGAAGDRLLLCSDGVHELVSAELLLDILQTESINTVAARLVAASNEAGGRDNATALVLDLGAS